MYMCSETAVKIPSTETYVCTEDTVCEDNNQIKLTTFRKKEELMMERYDAEGQISDKDKHDGDKEEKKSITDEAVFAVQAGAIKPTPFPRNAK